MVFLGLCLGGVGVLGGGVGFQRAVLGGGILCAGGKGGGGFNVDGRNGEVLGTGGGRFVRGCRRWCT